MPNKKKHREAVKTKVKSFWSEFKIFAIKGSVIDLAVAIIIGTSFNTIVQSLVHDIVMPSVGKLLGNVDFSQLFINLSSKSYDTLSAAESAGAPVIKYGLFINNVINFLIISLTVFVILKIFFKSKFEKQEA